MIRIKASDLKLFAPEGAGKPRVKKPAPVLRPAGKPIAEFVVPGDAVPWRAPAVLKGIAITPAHVKTWKEKVAMAAHRAGLGQAHGIEPYAGPVWIDIWFFKGHKVKRRWGSAWVTRPDIDNLTKGIADSLTGNVFKVKPKRKKGEPKVRALNLPPSPIGRILDDDNVVADLTVRKRYGPESLVYIRVVPIEPVDRQAMVVFEAIKGKG